MTPAEPYLLIVEQFLVLMGSVREVIAQSIHHCYYSL